MQLQQAQVCAHIFSAMNWIKFQTPRGIILVYFEAYTIGLAQYVKQQ